MLLSALDAHARAHVDRVRRWSALTGVASVLLCALAGALLQRAHARAEELAREGVPAVGVVVDRYGRGKGTYVLVEYVDRTGVLHRAEVPTNGTFTDAWADYPQGQPVEVRYRADRPEDVRTGPDWNTPGTLSGPATVSAAVGATAGVFAVVFALGARSQRRRLAAGRWAVVEPVLGDGPRHDRPVTVPVPDVRGGAVRLETWPVPERVEVLVEPAPRRSVVLRLPGQPQPQLTTFDRERGPAR